MILDKELEFSAAQSVTATAASTNVIDLGSARDVGAGEVLELVVAAKTALTGTLATIVQGSVDEAFTSPVTIQTLPSFAAAAAAGSKVQAYLQPVATSYRYIRLQYSGLTAGTVAAYLTKGVDAQKTYADNITIS